MASLRQDDLDTQRINNDREQVVQRYKEARDYLSATLDQAQSDSERVAVQFGLARLDLTPEVGHPDEARLTCERVLRSAGQPEQRDQARRLKISGFDFSADISVIGDRDSDNGVDIIRIVNGGNLSASTAGGTIVFNGAGGFDVRGSHAYAEEGTFTILTSVTVATFNDLDLCSVPAGHAITINWVISVKVRATAAAMTIYRQGVIFFDFDIGAPGYQVSDLQSASAPRESRHKWIASEKADCDFGLTEGQIALDIRGVISFVDRYIRKSLALRKGGTGLPNRDREDIIRAVHSHLLELLGPDCLLGIAYVVKQALAVRGPGDGNVTDSGGVLTIFQNEEREELSVRLYHRQRSHPCSSDHRRINGLDRLRKRLPRVLSRDYQIRQGQQLSLGIRRYGPSDDALRLHRWVRIRMRSPRPAWLIPSGCRRPVAAAGRHRNPGNGPMQ